MRKPSGFVRKYVLTTNTPHTEGYEKIKKYKGMCRPSMKKMPTVRHSYLPVHISFVLFLSMS
jgi:hypothetical protein